MPKCKAHTSGSKRPCKKDAIAGGTVCQRHGGGAPQVKAAAKMRLLALVDPALAVLARTMKPHPEPNPQKYKTSEAYMAALAAHARDQVPAAVALKAATEVLDRAGLDLENKTEMGGRQITVRFVKAKE